MDWPRRSTKPKPKLTGAEYVSELYKDRLAWYSTAQNRATLVLTINGVFSALVTSVLIGKASDVKEIIGVFGPETWFFFSLTVGALAISLTYVAFTFIGRTHRRDIQGAKEANCRPERIPAKYMWWFSYITQVERERFQREASSADPSLITEALASNAWVLSTHLDRQFRYLSIAFTSTIVAFGSFLATGVSYLIHVA